MELELGLCVPASGVAADVLLTAPDGARLDQVAPALLSCVLPPGRSGRLSLAGRPLPHHALVGEPPLVRGALLEVDPDLPRPAALELRCVAGPDAGGVWPLPDGALVVVGRGSSSDVRVDDPLLSREHCRLSVASTVTVVDLGTTNGTSVHGDEAAAGPVPLPVGAALDAGASRFVLAAVEAPAVAPRADGDGRLAWHRPPRLRPPPAVIEVDFPAPLPQRERAPIPVLAVVAPLLLGVVMWRLLGNAAFLLFTLLSPVLVVGGVVSERRSGRRRTRRQRLAWERDRAAAEHRLADAVRTDEQHRRTTWPDPATTALTARRLGSRLWERRRGDDDVLTVALGRGDVTAHVHATGDVPAGAAVARDVPLVVALTEVGVLGLAGAPPVVRAVARWLVVQSAVWHSPRDLQVVVLTESAAAGDWEWVRWLPHVRATGGGCRALLGLGVEQAAARVRELLDVVAARQAGATGHPRVLLVVDGARALRDVPGLASLLADGPAAGVVAVALDRDAPLLPGECGATAVVDAHGTVQLHGGAWVVAGRVDGVSLRLAEVTARSLAPLHDDSRDRGESADLPASVRWTDLVGLPLDGGSGDAEAVAARWGRGGRSTAALLGAGPAGPVTVDLCTDGPHALAAGATGSGKSELLQTLLASLALGNRPDELHVVLVDYKGGAAFGPCARLPHVVGLVTDLDETQTARALVSLTAELRRRERVLAEAGAKDVDELRRRTGTPGALPRLLLVVDEFASLAEELPDFVAGLVGVAMRGRSLGVHLVLATQRPAGVVSADIRANTNLRLCLGVTREADSRDVLDSAAAAHIPPTAPGRAYVRTGHASLTPLQVARVAGRRRSAVGDAAEIRATVLPAADLGEPCAAPAGELLEDSDLSLLVDACAAAAARLRLPSAAPPWLPPLPTVVTLDDLPQVASGTGLSTVRFGVLDLPELQSRAALQLDLDRDGHLLVVGAARSGRTTLLRTLAGSVAATTSPADVHAYVVDATGSGLAPLAGLPHVGAVVCRGDTERLDRLLGWLTTELRHRMTTLSRCGAGSVAEQRAQPGGAPLAHLLVMVDGWEALLADHQDRDAGRVVEQLHALLREGPAAGVHVVVTADRSGLTGRLASLVDRRLVLRLADPGDYALAGLPVHGRSRITTPPALPPGRGWCVIGSTTTAAQVALLAEDPASSAQTAALTSLAAATQAAPPGRAPRTFAPLPMRVQLEQLPTPPDSATVVLGVGSDAPAPVTVALDSDCPGFLVAGPPGSGRSTALLALADGLRSRDLQLVAVAPRASPLRELPGCVIDTSASGALAARLVAGP